MLVYMYVCVGGYIIYVLIHCGVLMLGYRCFSYIIEIVFVPVQC